MNTKTHDKHDVGKIEHFYRKILHILELTIAAVSIIVLLIALGLEIYHMFTVGSGYFADVNHMLHNLLTIVVGLEFVRMLIDTTPANILEVLTVAITRHVVLSHENPWSNVASIACIAALFAIKKFLIPKEDFKKSLSGNMKHEE